MKEEEEDLFESIIAQEDKPEALQEAVRNSMRARGDESVFRGAIWPLINKIMGPSSLKEATNQQYGLQGILLKESPSIFGGWDQRYLILKGHRLVYKENSSPISANAGIINFNLISCHMGVQTKDGCISSFRYNFVEVSCRGGRILVNNSEKEFVFKGITKELTQKWYKAIFNAISKSQGFSKNYKYLSKYPRFWRKDYQAEQEFRTTAQPGDILLFRGKKDSSVLQRAITMDEFGKEYEKQVEIGRYREVDHVGVILLNQMGDPLVFEANGGFGVGICPWVKFVQKKWWKQYDIIVHRRLNITRTPAFLQVIESFVGKNLGKEYNFSLGDYIFERKSSKDKEHKRYFCSSLVAKLYKTLQVLPQDKSCKQYLPSSFSIQDEAPLRSDGRFGHCFLQPEKIIVFEEEK